ncbi:MAG: SGNH/GDSL hydrolase family protein [Thalassotalea sp.]|nr:SGNH/GDSL hydrolase family protein [Thalassotalea sp.]
MHISKLKLKYRLVAFLTSPLWIFQGIRLKKVAVRLPEAAGERDFVKRNRAEEPQNNDNQDNVHQKTKQLNLLVLGDSVAAGVGCTTIQNALPGAVANELSSRNGAQVNTKVVATSGFKLNDVIHSLSNVGDFSADLVVISVGVNDAKGFTSLSKWQLQLKRLLLTIQNSDENKQIILLATPDLAKFPLIQNPLSSVLGLRAQLLNLVSQFIVSHMDNVHFHRADFDLSQVNEMFATDGFHPNSRACRQIAVGIADSY